MSWEKEVTLGPIFNIEIIPCWLIEITGGGLWDPRRVDPGRNNGLEIEVLRNISRILHCTS